MSPSNCYDDARRAEAYARLEFPGTYFLAYRDLPEILQRHVRGRRALDFGCGAGRSTRFLRALGFDVTGVDIAPDMIRKAREIDPGGAYRLTPAGGLRALAAEPFDLALCAFTFDNVPTRNEKIAILSDLGAVLADNGRIVLIVSDPEIYRHEWASFSTRDYPENAQAATGDRVRIVITDIDDPRPVEDVLWTHEAYLEVLEAGGLQVLDTCRPLGREDEPHRWVNETRIAPWVIYVAGSIGPSGSSASGRR